MIYSNTDNDRVPIIKCVSLRSQIIGIFFIIFFFCNEYQIEWILIEYFQIKTATAPFIRNAINSR